MVLHMQAPLVLRNLRYKENLTTHIKFNIVCTSVISCVLLPVINFSVYMYANWPKFCLYMHLELKLFMVQLFTNSKINHINIHKFEYYPAALYGIV